MLQLPETRPTVGQLKRCSKCDNQKPLNAFAKNQSWCRLCKANHYAANKGRCRQTQEAWKARNAERVKRYKRQWYEENREAMLREYRLRYQKDPDFRAAKRAASLAKDKEAAREAARQRYAAMGEEEKRAVADRAKEWAKQNPESTRERNARRRAARLRATPRWLTSEHRKMMQEVYREAALLTKTYGEAYHVDHVVPLKGADVCGLHVPWNLQVLPAWLNIMKSNTF